MPDPLVVLLLIVLGVVITIALYMIARMAVSDELDARGVPKQPGGRGRR